MTPERRGPDRRVGPRDRRQGPRRDDEIRETRKRRILDSQWTPYALMLAIVIYGFWRFDGFLHDLESQQDTLTELVVSVKTEGSERRDQTCLLFERQHVAAVSRLERSYELLTSGSLSGAPELERLAISSLPETRADAIGTRPPRYCKPTDVGSPEPFPEIPKRPKNL